MPRCSSVGAPDRDQRNSGRPDLGGAGPGRVDIGAFEAAAPSDLRVTLVRSTSSVHLSWRSNSATTDRFLVQRAQGSGAFRLVAQVSAEGAPSADVSWGDQGLSPNTRYRYRVRSSGPGSFTMS